MFCLFPLPPCAFFLYKQESHVQQLSKMQQHSFALKKDVVTYRSIAALESLLFVFMILLYAQRDKIPKDVAHFMSSFSTSSATLLTDDDADRRCCAQVGQMVFIHRKADLYERLFLSITYIKYSGALLQ